MRPMTSKATLALTLFTACLLGGARAPVEAGETPREDSPIQNLSKVLNELESKGLDVSDLRARLDALEPGWKQISSARRALEKKVEGFVPKVQALARSVQERAEQAGGNSGGNPLTGIGQGLDSLARQGADVAALRAELEDLRPGWEAIDGLQTRMREAAPDSRKPLQESLQAKIETYRPKVESLMKKVHALASKTKPTAGRPSTLPGEG